MTSTHETSLRAVHEKVFHVLGLLSGFWLIIKNETLSSAECGNEETQVLTTIFSLFEQIILLIRQAFHSNFYHHRQNIVFTLIVKPAKLRETLVDPDMVPNNAKNTFLSDNKLKKYL